MLDLNNLSQFTGTEHYYRTFLPRYYFTDGIKYVADQGGAYWLIDLALSYAIKFRKEAFLTVTLTVDLESLKGKATITDGNKNVLAVQQISFTDFPLEKVTFWIENRVIMLPSER